jgi:ribose-phosphate pyrophosphokinase
MTPGEPMALLTGSAHPTLAKAIAQEIGVSLTSAECGRFPDGEVSIRLGDNMRHRDVYLIQPTGPPVDENLMELLALVDACRRASAFRITTVIPYFGYARQDRPQEREPITGRLIANLLQRAGADQLLALDLHSAQVQGFFDIPVDSLTGQHVLVESLRETVSTEAVVVSPDAGFVRQATRFAAALGVPMAVTHKHRRTSGEVEAGVLVGDVQGKRPIIVDDMITTGSTIRRCLETLLAAGALPEVTVAATHGLFVGDAAATLAHAAIRQIVITDSLPAAPAAQILPIAVASIAPLLAEAIYRSHTGGSIRELGVSSRGERL